MTYPVATLQSRLHFHSDRDRVLAYCSIYLGMSIYLSCGCLLVLTLPCSLMGIAYNAKSGNFRSSSIASLIPSATARASTSVGPPSGRRGYPP